MSKVDEYTGNGMIVVSDGEVWAVDDSGLPDVIGEIGRVELSIEMPENLIGIYRVEHIMLFDEDVRGELSEAIELITDLINTVILGCEVLNARENFVNNKLALRKMIGVVLDNYAK